MEEPPGAEPEEIEVVDLHPVVHAVALRFRLIDGRVAMTNGAFETSARELVSVPADDRAEVTVALLALALKARRFGGAAAAKATHQILGLAGILLAGKKAR